MIYRDHDFGSGCWPFDFIEEDQNAAFIKYGKPKVETLRKGFYEEISFDFGELDLNKLTIKTTDEMETEYKKPINLDEPLLHFGGYSGATFTIRSAMEGIQIFGGIGSGKSSSVAYLLAKKLLERRYGFLVLTVKPGEADTWRRYAIETGREKDLVIISPGSSHRLNFLEYISIDAVQSGKPIAQNISAALKTVIRSGDEKDGHRSEDPFWEASLTMVITHCVELLLLAWGKVSVENLYHVIQTLPKPADSPRPNTEREEWTLFQIVYDEAAKKVQEKVEHWKKTMSPSLKLMITDQRQFEEAMHEAVPDARTMKYLYEFFFSSFKNLSSKTRSIVEYMASSFLYRLLSDPIYSLFCNSSKPTTVVPEDCFNKGSIIIVDLPVKEYFEAGRDAQCLVKYIWQRAMEKRVITDGSLPCVLFADENQFFLLDTDSTFQATARSARVISCLITQSINNYYAALGSKAEYRVKAYLGTLATKFFLANADIETNRYASDLVGEDFYTDPSLNISISKENFSQGQNLGVKLQKVYRPENFVSLATGSVIFNYTVEAIVHKQGSPIANGRNYAKVSFKQDRSNNF